MMSAGFWRLALLNTLAVVFGVTTLAAVIALPAAWLIERTDVVGKRWLTGFFKIPYAVPSFLMAISWIVLANPSVGWINVFSKALFGRENVINIYSLFGIIFVEASCLFSILFLNFAAGLEKTDPAYEEAARLAGASRTRIFFSISIPLLKGPIFAGVVSIAVASLASFGVPAMIGGPARVFVLTTGIYALIKDGSEASLHTALEVAAGIALVALVATVSIRRYIGAQEAIVGGKASKASVIPLGPKSRFAISGLLWAVIFFVFTLPATALIVSSFQIKAGAFGAASFGLKSWKYVLFDLADFQVSLVNSFVSSLSAALVILALSVAVAVLGRKSRWRAVAETISLLFYSLPGTVLGLLLILLFAAMPGGWVFSNTLGILILAYTLKYLMLGMRTLLSSADLIHPSLFEAARLSGAKRRHILSRIWIPLLKPALLATFLLCVVPCFAELTMSVLLYGPGTQNLGVLLFQLQEYADRSSAAVVGSLALIAVFFLEALLAKFKPRSAS